MALQSFPVELLTQVLKHATQPFQIESDSYFDNLSTVAAVCKSWLATIKSEPGFWSYIYLDDYSSLDLLSATLKRSGALSLTIHINLLDFYTLHRYAHQRPDRTGTVSDILSVLAPHIHRCTDLTLCARDEKAAVALTNAFRLLQMPMLSHVDIDLVTKQDALPLVLFSTTPPPGLHQFRFNGHFIDVTFALLSGIHILFLDSFYIAFTHLRRALENMPQLTHLHILNVRCNVYSESRDTMDRACDLATVTNLDVQLWGESGVQVLRLLRMPNLLRFSLRTDNTSDLTSVVYDCVAHYKNLTHLTMHSTLSSTDLIRDLLGFLPALTHLNVMGCPSYTYFLFLRFFSDNAAVTSVRHCALPGYVSSPHVEELLQEIALHHTSFEMLYVDGHDHHLVRHYVDAGRISRRHIGWDVDFFNTA
ncbi:hypothetical protein C8R43DRAFT_1130952 [Mycena crocata]|nr:hypothetical protein C8R43DRAFT_1130952 [Mycena crocata]